MKSLMQLVESYKGTDRIAPIATGVRSICTFSSECGAVGSPGYGGNCSLPWNNCHTDCDCSSNCECYECYEGN